MITLSDEQIEVIDGLISKNQLFAIYKMPQKDQWHFVMQEEGEPTLLDDIAQLNKQDGYIIAPFKIDKEVPLVMLRIDRRSLPSQEEVKRLSMRPFILKEEEQRQSDMDMFHSYQACFEAFMAPLVAGQMPKLVLSRHRVQQRDSSSSLAQSFELACNRYPNAYVYLVNSPQTGLWMGSTPEFILSGKKENWHTVALAGTQVCKEGVPIQWDAKNIQEQELVVHYVDKQLQAFGVHPRIVGPSTIQAGPVAHLVSHFYFTLKEQDRLGDLLRLLHPTPAVCGLPKEEAYQFILDHEGHCRKYYSGFIGELSTQGQTNLFVNLRCMHIHQKSYTLYAGGGLLASSELQSEWMETENKMQTMGTLLN